MNAEQFCYWLQGRLELQPDVLPSAAEWKMIGEHLGLVFKKVTPPLVNPRLNDYLDRYNRPVTPSPVISPPFDIQC